MKRYIKIIALVLCAICAVAVLAACNENVDNVGADDTFFVEYMGVKIVLGDENAGQIIESLGEPKSVEEVASCGDKGAQVRYAYSAINLYVVETEGVSEKTVDGIELRSDSVQTPEGVYIGMSAVEAEELLGAPDKAQDNALTYIKGKYFLRISLDDGVVSGIDYMTDTE